jgi:hypothetical protein
MACLGPSPTGAIVASGLLLLLGACTTAAGPGAAGPEVSLEAYASLRHAIRTDPAVRTAFTEDCMRKRAAEPEAARRATAELLGVGADRVDRVFCERETVAIGRGYISHADFAALTARRGDAAAALRVIEALRLAAGPRMTPEQFARQRDELRSPAFRNSSEEACEAELGWLWPPGERERWAADLGVGPDEAVGVYCRRLDEAIASGRLGYEEWAALTAPGGDPDARRRAVRVLREEPGGRA